MTILVILEALSGLFGVLGGLALIAVGMFAGMPMMELPEFLSMIASVLGFVLLVYGLISFALAYGLWKSQGWAWTWSLIFAVIGAIFAIVPMLSGAFTEIFSVIIALIIIYYLTRPHVKSYFGK